MNIEGATVVMGGASAGIGLGTARAFARRKPKVIILVARRQERLDKAVSELQKLAPSATIRSHSCDLSDPDAVRNMANTIRSEHGSIDRLYHSSGVGELRSIEEEDGDNFRLHWASTAFAAFNLVHAFIGDLRRNPKAHIIIGGGSLVIHLPFFANGYISSRSALAGFAGALREDLHDTGVRVLYCEAPAVAEGSGYFKDSAGSWERLPFAKMRLSIFYKTDTVIGEGITRAVERNARIYRPFPVWLMVWMSQRWWGRPLMTWLIRRTALPYDQGGPLSGNRQAVQKTD